MKYKYLKISGDLVWGTNELTKDDLIRAKAGGYEVIINLEDFTQYDPEENIWKEVEGRG